MRYDQPASICVLQKSELILAGSDRVKMGSQLAAQQIQSGNLQELLNILFTTQDPMIEEVKIDENAQSRQLAVYGHEAQAKLMALRVFIHGVTGLGVEVAKNLILAGPKLVSLYDPFVCTIQDMGSNFYIKQEHVGKKTRAEACIKNLKELNLNTKVDIASNDNIEEIVNNHGCVVVIDNYNKAYLQELDEACREKGVGFIYAGNLGLYGFTFVDFGENHKVLDLTGEQQKSIFISLITKQKEGAVLLHENKKHGFNDGDTVVFREVEGMTELNGKSYQIKVLSPSAFAIGDTSQFSEYISGGIATEIKMPTFQKFNSLKKSLTYPYAPGTTELPICNWQLFGHPQQLHVVLNGLLNFHKIHNRLPNNLSVEDAAELTKICHEWLSNKTSELEFNFTVQKIDQKLIDSVSLFSQTQISPICSFWGGIITQEIIKLTGKYSPLRQWLHHQFFEIIADGNHAFAKQKVNLSHLNSRYSNYNTLFGDKFVEEVAKTKTLLVGAGALGCEFIKMFALMGFGTAEHGQVLCTDDDNIEISNLNRQFLFRKNHVGKNKSEVACHIGKKINKNSKLESIKLKVGVDTEEYFNEQFWQGLDIVVNAVDNVKARQYIDDQCVWYEKPFFESGTLGTKCHSQVIIPHHTQSYNDIIDPPEEQFAVCTLKLFPYQIEHTIQWAREYFQTVFAIPSQDLKSLYVLKGDYVDKILKENKNITISKDRLHRMKRLHEINESKTYLSCVEAAVRIFENAFQNQIAQLLQVYPEDYVSKETGKLYWSGLKRMPKILRLNNKDPLHLEFIQATANIFAKIFGIAQETSSQKVAQLITQVKPIEFVATKIKLKIDQSKSDNSAVEQEGGDQEEEEVMQLAQELRSIDTSKCSAPEPVIFEKDDPTNWHIEFMGGVSNLRARNYKIDEVDNFKVKLIAGKIIPAIATATALIVGAVGVEIIKYLLKVDSKQFKEGYFKNVTVNLALPLFIFNDPLAPTEITDKKFDALMGEQVRAVPGKFTKWNKMEVQGPMTVEQLKNEFEKKYDVRIDSISYKNFSLYANFKNQSKEALERFGMEIRQAAEQVSKKKIVGGKKSIMVQIVSCRDKNGVFCSLPDIKYVF